MSLKKKVEKTEVKPFECIRCGFKADTAPRMQIHIDRKNPCKVSETGVDVDITKYRQQILNHTFETMFRCIFCNEYFDNKDGFIDHKKTCDEETLKKIPMDETGKNYCERCHKAFKFRDSDHTIVCNATLDDYKKIEEERDNLEEEVQNLRMLNRKLNDELIKFAKIVNKCIDDYKRSNLPATEEESEES